MSDHFVRCFSLIPLLSYCEQSCFDTCETHVQSICDDLCTRPLFLVPQREVFRWYEEIHPLTKNFDYIFDSYRAMPIHTRWFWDTWFGASDDFMTKMVQFNTWLPMIQSGVTINVEAGKTYYKWRITLASKHDFSSIDYFRLYCIFHHFIEHHFFPR
ncbi:hypothetical protein N9R79_05340 [Vibrio sp.]|nr:hypothetical protein [Vibrio sp.]